MEEKNEDQKDIEKQKKRLFIPFFIMLLGSFLLIAVLFVPFASATEDHRLYLQEHPNGVYAEEIGMTNKEAITLSLVEFGEIYAKTVELGMSKEISITCLVIISVYALLVILTTIFSVLKKPIVSLIFNVLSLGVFRVIMWDFDDRGVILNSSYDWGMARYFCYVGVAAVFIGGVYLLITKIKLKKERELTQKTTV